MEMIFGGKKDCAGRISGGEIFFITSKFLHLRLPHFLTCFFQKGEKHQNYYISFLVCYTTKILSEVKYLYYYGTPSECCFDTTFGGRPILFQK